ncbi:hypothetical protein HY625_01610 [Candidatus Uhrbacteria bacterium]|nr:hypothetical protein [Candidatus Uhrbacteria bacterium]
MKKNFFLLTVASLLLLGSGCARTKAPASLTATPSATSQKADALATPKAPIIQNNSVTAEKQSAGGRVNIANVVLAVPGFVMIHEDTAGKPGGVIGRSEVFQAGVYTVTVSLTRPSKAGETLYAMVHGADEAPLKNVKGATAMSAFVITK